MSDLTFRSDMTVDLIDSMGNDDSVIRAAKVSTLTDTTVNEMSDAGKEKFIDFLVANRHGSPTESVVFTFRIEAPIFVWREFQRHRIAAYSEQSGRYTELKPVFYVPDADRNLVQVGKPGEYTFTQGDYTQLRSTTLTLQDTSVSTYDEYQYLLNRGIAREVARMVLPLNIYSTAYVTMNLRSLTNFLSLRRNVEGQTFPSFPQREIEMVAEQMEEHADSIAPITLDAFRRTGRVGL